MDPTPKTIEWFLKEGAVYGIAVVFLVCVLVLLLWIAVTLVRLANTWVPQWFAKSIDSHDRVCSSLETLEETLRCIHEQSHRTKEGLHGVVKAAHGHLSDRGVQERLGIKSETFHQLKAAERALRGNQAHAKLHRPKDSAEVEEAE